MSVAVKATTDDRIFEVFVLTRYNGGEIIHFKFLTIEASEDYIYIEKDEFCPSITFSTETIYKLVDMVVNQVNIMLTYGLPSQIDLAIKVSQYKIQKIKSESEYNREQAEKDYQKSLAKLKKQFGSVDE